MKKALLPIITHLVLAFVVYQWLFAGVDGARNAATFVICVNGLLGLLCFGYSFSSHVDAKFGVASRFVTIVTGLIDLLVIAALAWYGYFLLASIHSLAYAGVAVLRDAAKQKARAA